MNTINRHNYEEIFLMYVDNELTNQQRAEVELFVQQNPDLEKEFEMLKQTKLTADEEIMFAHKTDLLKIKGSIGTENYEEFFLLYIDNELNENGKDAVEKFVLQQPKLQDEFILLKQTVLPQEKIVFPHKKTLYRREERRVVPFNWKKMAVAAAFIGIAALVWRIAPHGNNINSRTVTTVQQKKQTVKRAQSGKQDQAVQPLPQSSTNANKEFAAKEPTKVKKDTEAIVKTEKKNKIKPVEKNAQEVNNDIALKNKKDKDVNNPLPPVAIPENKDDAVVKNDNPVVTDINIAKDNSNEEPLEKAKSLNAMNDHPDVHDLIQPAVYKELNTNDDDNLRNTLYVGNMGLNKNKVRGIMKKVGGLFAGKSKNSSDEKGKLHVANFELNTN